MTHGRNIPRLTDADQSRVKLCHVRRDFRPKGFVLRGLLMAAILLSTAAADAARAQQGKLIFGWVEQVVVSRAAFTLHAKLDTGANTASLDAQDITRFERNGEPWVRFTIAGEEPGQQQTLERPLSRDVLIKRHKGPSQRRPVVIVPICLGPFYLDMEVSLIDRSHFNYPVLIGRRALEGIGVVDAERALTHDPSCPELKENPPPEWLFSSSFEAQGTRTAGTPLVPLFFHGPRVMPPLDPAASAPMVE